MRDAPSEPRAVVLYDECCGFCRWALAGFLAWDRRGRLRPVAIGSREGGDLLDGLSERQRESSWHLVTADGHRFSAGAVFPPLLALLPGAMALGGLLARAPRGCERAYRVVAARRSALGRCLPGRAIAAADRRIAEHAS